MLFTAFSAINNTTGEKNFRLVGVCVCVLASACRVNEILKGWEEWRRESAL